MERKDTRRLLDLKRAGPESTLERSVRSEHEGKDKRSSRLSRKKRIILAGVVLIFVLGFQEAAFRLVFPVPEVINFNRINYSSTTLNPEMKSLRYLSNAAFTWTSSLDGERLTHHLNLYGFRDRDWTVAGDPDIPRVMFIGDSFVEGFMVGDDETIPRVFEECAKQEDVSLEAMCFGVGASQLPQYIKLIRDATSVFRCRQLILVFYANDLPVPNFDPQWLKSPIVPQYANQWKPRIQYVIENLLAGKTVARIWTSAPFPFIPAVPDPGNPWSSEEKAAHYESCVTPVIADAMKKGLFNPHVVNAYATYHGLLQKSCDVDPHLRALKSFLAERSVPLLVAYIPSADQVSNEYLPYHSEYTKSRHATTLMGDAFQIHARILKGACDRLGIPFLDLTKPLRDTERAGTRLYWNYDEHMRAEGYALVGRHLFDWWRKMYMP